jgi:peptidoglycan/xylan/chitin deacetylase (PgdA/CDA1 family)
MSLITTMTKELLQAGLLRDSFQWRLSSGDAVALTFDDGPHPVHTPHVLDVLARHGVKATYFLVGERAARCPKLVERIFAEGHGLASHTYTHRELPRLRREELEWELATTRKLLREMTGRDSNLVRPPRGRVSPLVLLRIRSLGYRLVHWSRTYSDYRQDGREALLQRVMAEPPVARDIILLHDNNPYTGEVLHEILPRWLEAGLRFAAI